MLVWWRYWDEGQVAVKLPHYAEIAIPVQVCVAIGPLRRMTAWVPASSREIPCRPLSYWVFAFLSHSSPALACEGPGAVARMRFAEILGWGLGTFVGALVIVCWVLGRHSISRAHFRWLLALAAVHPGWWLRANSGDCGAERILFSILVTVGAPVFGLWVLTKIALSRLEGASRQALA